MLTNCKNCSFFSKKGCAVNPTHWLVWNTVKQEKNLSDEQKEAISNLSQSCGEFEEAEDLRTVSATVTLPLRIWQKIADARKDEERDSRYIPLMDVADKVLKEAKTPKEDDSVPDFQ